MVLHSSAENIAKGPNKTSPDIDRQRHPDKHLASVPHFFRPSRGNNQTLKLTPALEVIVILLIVVSTSIPKDLGSSLGQLNSLLHSNCSLQVSRNVFRSGSTRVSRI